MAGDINLQNLSNARSARKLSIHEVATFTKISADRLEQFEDGSAAPSVLQLSKLSDLYNVSLFELFGETPLEITPTLPDFRKEHVANADLSAPGLSRLWDVERIAEFTAQLLPVLNIELPSTRKFRRLTNQDLPSGDQVRALFDEWRAVHGPKIKYQGTEVFQFFKHLRHYMETVGCLTVVNDAPTEDYLGFYKSFVDNGQTAFVNKQIGNEKRQLFTLAHEFAHFIIGAEGISDPYVSVHAVEKRSNEFAASFLAPDEFVLDLVRRTERIVRENPERLVSWVSANSVLSLQAAALRLKELDVIRSGSARPFFGRIGKGKIEEGASKTLQSKPMGRSVSVGRKLSEVGTFASYVAAIAVEKKLIDSVDVSRALRISENLQPDVFDLAKRRFEASIE